jgi:hypothetical protein
MSKNVLKKEDVKESHIADWKKQYTGVFVYNTKDGQKKAWFRNPTRAEMAASQAVVNNGLDSNEVLAKACFLAGDEEVCTEDKYLIGLSKHLEKVIVKVEGELIEL